MRLLADMDNEGTEMTIIAWDGKTLAADKAATNCGYRRTVTKLFRVPGGIVAFAGDGDRALALLEWFRTGRKLSEWPETQKVDQPPDAVFVDINGKLWTYCKTPYPQRSEDKFDAFGCGRDYALAAMYLGQTAREAVLVASHFDAFCANGVDAMTLDEDEFP